MKPDLSPGELKKYHNREDVVRETAQQIIKDFALFGLEISFPPDLKYAYNHLSEQLNQQVLDLLHSSSTKILSILYQIDIPERLIQQKVGEQPDTPLSEVVTELIFQRELKKVLTRRYFKEVGI